MAVYHGGNEWYFNWKAYSKKVAHKGIREQHDEWYGGPGGSIGGTKRPSKGQGHYRISRDVGYVTFKVLKNEVALNDQALQLASTTLTATVMRAIAYSVTHLLSRAILKTPWKSGKLRESGLASVQFGRGNVGSFKPVARGQKDGTVKVVLGSLDPTLLAGKDRIDGSVSFVRTGVDEFGRRIDVALWAHEELEPFEKRKSKERGDGSFYAKRPGTGPKYLQIPWLQHKDHYWNTIEDAATGEFYKTLQMIGKVVYKGKQPHEVPIIIPDKSKVSRLGYFRGLESEVNR